MPDVNPSPTHVLTIEAVRWSIETLGVQRMHPTFVMYLYLRSQQRAGLLSAASPSSDELLALITMPGHPVKPYYFPFIDRGKRTGAPLPTFWRARNISGSWSPGSIHRQRPAQWLGANESAYAWPDDHVELALSQMLYGQRTSALAVGAYFLRNDGLVLVGEPAAEDVISAFRSKFDYPAEAQDEFERLFDEAVPAVTFNWFERAQPNPLLVEDLASV